MHVKLTHQLSLKSVKEGCRQDVRIKDLALQKEKTRGLDRPWDLSHSYFFLNHFNIFFQHKQHTKND